MERLSKLCESYINKFPTFETKNTKNTWTITDVVQAEIINILWDWTLANVLIQLTKHNHAWEYSDNIINEFEEEREIKVLDINQAEIINKLIWLDAVKVFDGWIHDVYLDYPNKSLENKNAKVSFRFRFKVSNEWELSIYYTIKQKIKDEVAVNIRSAYEKELKLWNPAMVADLLWALWVVETREKLQKRVSLTKWNTKYDFNESDRVNIPGWLEIETNTRDQASWILELLWIEWHTVMNVGSRKFYKHYWEEYSTINEESKILIPKPMKDFIKEVS